MREVREERVDRLEETQIAVGRDRRRCLPGGQLGKEARLIEKVGGLEMRERLIDICFLVRDRSEQSEWYVLADH